MTLKHTALAALTATALATMMAVPGFAQDKLELKFTTVFSTTPIDADGSLRRRLSLPTFENMVILQLCLAGLNSVVVVWSSQASVLSHGEASLSSMPRFMLTVFLTWTMIS